MFGMTGGTLLDPPVAFGRVWEKVCCTGRSRTTYSALAEYKLGDSFHHLLRSLFLWITFMRILRHVSEVQLPCFITLLKICLIISFVVSSHVLMSPARIPLLSLALPLSLLFAVCTSSSVISGFYFVCSCFRIRWVLQLLSRSFICIQICSFILRRHWHYHFLM